MASEDTKSTFPSIPAAHWWALRKKFKQSIPGVVTDNYLASVLNMKLSSAKANVLPALKATKILDDSLKPTDRARRWRDDDQYKKVCEEILVDLYPADLREAISDPISDRGAVERWFANHTGAGQEAVRKMAQLYIILAQANPVEGQGSVSDKPARTPKPVPAQKERKAHRPAVGAVDPAAAKGDAGGGAGKRGPSIHINLQVHISADASTDQIEQVFASMAKHIYAGGISE